MLSSGVFSCGVLRLDERIRVNAVVKVCFVARMEKEREGFVAAVGTCCYGQVAFYCAFCWCSFAFCLPLIKIKN